MPLPPSVTKNDAGMSPEEFRAVAHQAVDWIADYLASVGDLPVTPPISPGHVAARLPASAPEQGEPAEALLNDFRELIVPGITHWNHPRFLGYFAISGSAPGILGEMLAAALNVNHMLWQTSPAATELEQVTLSWLRQWIGLPEEFFGIIHDTASTGTMHAVIASRERAAPDGRHTGDYSRLTLYTSEHSHSSVDKAALAAGIGLNQVRHIATDEAFRMRADALAAAMEQDLAAGLTPCCVVATVGTTSTASIDSVADVAAVAKRFGAWLHVDAAYAGTAAILEEYRFILTGAEQADSLVVNPHKWMFTPVDLSALYFKDRAAMRRAVSLADTPAYLRTSDGDSAVNLADYSLALGRRFRSLKLWFVMRSFGREGVAQVLRRHIAAAEWLAQMIREDDRFELVAPQMFSLVCFRYRGSDEDNRALLNAINQSGVALLSSTVLHGRFAIRVAVGNLATSAADLELVWQSVVASIPPRENDT